MPKTRDGSRFGFLREHGSGDTDEIPRRIDTENSEWIPFDDASSPYYYPEGLSIDSQVAAEAVETRWTQSVSQ